MKLLFPTPITYDGNDARFLARDGARFAQYLSSHGHEGVKVILSDSASPSGTKSPLLAMGIFRQWCDPAYWQTFHADGALCYFGLGSNRFPPVVKAMRKAGIRLAVKLDTAFGISPYRPFSPKGLARTYWLFRQRHSPCSSIALTFLKTAKMGFLPSHSSLISYLSLFDLITTESPLATELSRAWCNSRGRADLAERITTIIHPVPDNFGLGKGVPRTADIVLAAASDWRNPLKGGRIAVDALKRFLDVHPSWHAVVVGNNSDALSHVSDSAIRFVSMVSSFEMQDFYRQAKVFLVASGAESGPNVVFEAAASGCSVVFPPSLAHLSWIVDSGMGTISSSRTPKSLAEAVGKEADIWKEKPNRVMIGNHPPLLVSELSEQLLELLLNRS